MVVPHASQPEDAGDCDAVDVLRATIVELRRSNAELEQFAYVVSHDLREPLRMVTAYSQLLSQRYTHRLDEDGKEFLHYITDGAHRMERLITDILAFSRVGRCAIPPQGFPAGEAVDAALADLAAMIEDTAATIHVAALPDVVGDRGQIERLFENLIGNALKYSRPGIAPVVRIDGEELPDCWRFRVADNGIGIDPADHERVFMVFERVNGRDVPGTGLGLAIAKKIVDRHGGRIWVDSTPDIGSNFHFSLARRKAG